MRSIGRVAALGALVLGVAWFLQRGHVGDAEGLASGVAKAAAPADAALQHPAGATGASSQDEAQRAFADRAQGRQISVSGVVERLLADDRKGSAHQRFIIATDSGQSLLVAHNIDLAPRLDGLTAGDTVRLFGEYEWNAQGGVMHWTHHDPDGSHVAGYIDWKGRRYQ